VDGRDAHNHAITVNTAREPGVPELPKVTALQMTSGNPSRQSVAFSRGLAQASNVDLSIYAVDGRRVAVLMSGMREPGTRTVTWDGRDDSGGPMSSGVFYVG
jgi:flagellar hook assembly protein FlgD